LQSTGTNNQFNEDIFNSIPFANQLLNRTYKSLSYWLSAGPGVPEDSAPGEAAEDDKVGGEDNNGDEESARDNPLLAPYWKMLGFGVPLESVTHKMKSDGITEALRDLFSTENGFSPSSKKATTVPTSAVDRSSSMNSSNGKTRASETPRIKFRKLHWEKITPHRATRSLFSDLTVSDSLPVCVSSFQFDQLVKAFSERPRTKGKNSASVKPKRDKGGVRLLSFQRAQNIM
jgi:hypothetical protein